MFSPPLSTPLCEAPLPPKERRVNPDTAAIRDTVKMARNMGFPVESLEHLTRAQATKMLNRLDELNDPKRKVPR